MITCIQVIAPTAVQSYVEVNDMKHYSTIYELEKDGVVLSFKSEQEACDYLGVVKCSVASCYRRGHKCRGYTINRIGISTHHETKTKLHKRWESMIARCEYQKHPHYKDYGERGISVCEEWHDYEKFRAWAIKNGYSDNLTIDRIDNNGNYEPSNCRFITIKEQMLNKRNNHWVIYGGERLTVSQLSEKYSVPESTVRWRLEHLRDVLTGARMDGNEVE